MNCSDEPLKQPQSLYSYQAITVINTECAAPVQVSICSVRRSQVQRSNILNANEINRSN